MGSSCCGCRVSVRHACLCMCCSPALKSHAEDKPALVVTCCRHAIAEDGYCSRVPHACRLRPAFLSTRARCYARLGASRLASHVLRRSIVTTDCVALAARHAHRYFRRPALVACLVTPLPDPPDLSLCTVCTALHAAPLCVLRGAARPAAAWRRSLPVWLGFVLRCRVCFPPCQCVTVALLL